MTCECVFCGASGFGPTGWTTVCPTCAASPARQAWHVETHAIRAAMQLEAFGRGLPWDRIAVTPAILARCAAVGPCPVS